jgi:ubiquinone/menaquinone biosynthesis C-methylase UbiE
MAGPRFNPKRASHLDGRLRRRFMDAGAILADIQPAKQEKWAEIGAGTGYFTLPLSRLVSEVIALDISEEMLSLLRQRVDSENIHNIKTIQSPADSLTLADGVVDAVLMAFVAHELDRPEVSFHEVSRILTPGGRLCIVEYNKSRSLGPPASHRLDTATVDRWGVDAGLIRSQTWRWSHSLLGWKFVDLAGWEYRKNAAAGSEGQG